MNMNILDIDVNNIEETDNKEPGEENVDKPGDVPVSPADQGFGSVDMWRLRGGRKSSSSQQSSVKFSI
jgi:hypothetical protein